VVGLGPGRVDRWVRVGAGGGLWRIVGHEVTAGTWAWCAVACGDSVGGGLPRLRKARAFHALRRSIAAGHKKGFSVAQYSVMGTHMHMIVEARDRGALSRGIQGLKVRMAKALNRVWKRGGTVFPERYHARQLRTPAQTRNALAYVLCNKRKHAKQQGRTYQARWVDPFSSARQFDGWSKNVRQHEDGGTVRPPGTWLLRTGWRKRGLIDPATIPSQGPP
jgi:putative transposase